MRDYRDAKAMAHILRASLASNHIDITLGRSLELIANMFGLSDWNTLAAAIRRDVSATDKQATEPRPAIFGRCSNSPREVDPAITRALACAKERKHELVTLEHLLLALLDDPDVSTAVEACEVDVLALRLAARTYVDKSLKALVRLDDGGEATATVAFDRAVRRATFQSRVGETASLDMLLSMFHETESAAVWLMSKHGLSQQKIETVRSRPLPLFPLTHREEKVLRMRFGIGMNTDHTVEEVGRQFSTSRERIRQIEAKALRKLKHPSRRLGEL